jgi:starvation-inducible DNA-binding protein
VTGRHFCDDHLLLDEQATQIFAMVDDIAERARKMGGTTLRSVGDIARHQRLTDNDIDRMTALEMLEQLLNDDRELTGYLRSTHDLCDRHGDVATASLVENWLDEAERRSWFIGEITRDRG